MIRQPEKGTRNVNDLFYEHEAKRIAEMNRILGDIDLTKSEEKILIWLAGWDDSVIKNMLSVMEKLKEKGRSQSREPQSRESQSRESIADRLKKYKDDREGRGGYAPNKKHDVASRDMER